MKQSIKNVLLTVLVALVSVSASAYDFEVDGIRYDITSFTELTVAASSLSEGVSGTLTIPSSVTFNGKDLTVTEIKEGFAQNNTQITELNVNANVTSIGASAFSGCTGLTKVKLPESVAALGESSFSGCTSLNSIDAQGLIEISDNTFLNCSALVSVKFPELSSTETSSFENCTVLATVDMPKLVTIGKCSFKGCSSLSEIELPLSVTSIGESAFEECSSLTSFVIPNSVKEMGYNIFSDCKRLKSVSIGSGITILHRCFDGCEALSYIRFEDSAETLYLDFDPTEGKHKRNVTYAYPSNTSLFKDFNLAEVYIGRNLSTKGYVQMASTGYYSYFIPNPAFSNSKVSKVTFGPRVSQLPTYDKSSGFAYRGEWEGAFQNCTNLVEVSFNSSISSIDANAFKGCTNLEKIVLPNKIVNIGDSAFKGCIKLASIELGSRLSEIGTSAFDGCESISEIRMKANTPPTYQTGFDSKLYINTALYVPTGYSDAYKSADPWQNFWGLKESDDLISIFEVDSVTYEITAGNDVTVIGKTFTSNKDLVVNSVVKYNNVDYNVSAIDDEVFKKCDLLTSVSINGIATIGEKAFYGCKNIKTVSLSDGLLSLGDGCFYGNTALTTINIPLSLTSLPANCFYICDSLKSIDMEGIQSIGDKCFYDCDGLEQISLPSSLTQLGSSVFDYCSNLKELRIEDSPNVLEIPSGSYDGATKTQKKTVNGKTILFKIAYYNGYFAGLPIEKLYIGRSLSDKSRYTLTGDGGVDAYVVTSYDAPFNDLSKLTELTIGEEVTALGPVTEHISEVDMACSAGSFNKCSNIKSVIVDCQNPPTGAAFTDDVYSKAELTIPDGTTSLYEVADGWKEFLNRKETGITELQMDKTNGTLHIYDLQGRKLSKPQEGVNIINGKKVLVK